MYRGREDALHHRASRTEFAVGRANREVRTILHAYPVVCNPFRDIVLTKERRSRNCTPRRKGAFAGLVERREQPPPTPPPPPEMDVPGVKEDRVTYSKNVTNPVTASDTSSKNQLRPKLKVPGWQRTAIVFLVGTYHSSSSAAVGPSRTPGVRRASGRYFTGNDGDGTIAAGGSPEPWRRRRGGEGIGSRIVGLN